MKTSVAIILALVWAIPAGAITIDTVPVGDIGNPKDIGNPPDLVTGNRYGDVNYAYNIGKYGVTVGQYTAFLNAVASTDTYSLYNTNMQSDISVAGISRSGSSGSYTYGVIGSANHPVTYLSWGDMARFANWLHNGQPTGAEDLTTTEDGAYFLNGAIFNTALLAVTRKPGATWFIPTENEWYKAAYYQPAAAGGDSDGYWAYPMKTNSVPNSAAPPGTSAPNPTRVGNFYADDHLANAYDNGYAVTGTTRYSSSQNYLTDVGAYTSSPSYYGTFDQGANVVEWNETKIMNSPTSSGFRALRGASYEASSVNMRSSSRGGLAPEIEFRLVGFRVASISVPEPTTVTLAVVAFASLQYCRRRRPPHNRV